MVEDANRPGKVKLVNDLKGNKVITGVFGKVSWPGHCNRFVADRA
jgi:hypothetical protein